MCCGKTESGNFLTKLKLKPVRKRIVTICKDSLIRRETITATNWGRGRGETIFLVICLSKGFILCPLFVLHEKKASQRGEFSSWECTWGHAGTHAKSTCTHTPLATSSIRTLVAERWGPRYAPGWQISSRRIQSSLSLWPSGHLLWIKSRKGHRPHHLRFHKQLRRV